MRDKTCLMINKPGQMMETQMPKNIKEQNGAAEQECENSNEAIDLDKWTKQDCKWISG